MASIKVMLGCSITYYKWYVDGSPEKSCSSFGWTFTLASGQSEKQVQVKLRVRDDEGNWATKTITYTIRRQPGRTYYLKDHLGNVRVTVNEDGDPIGWDDYYPFGKIMPGRSSNNANPNDLYKYTGYGRDTEANLDLIYAGARYMDPEIGRWLAVDPLASKYPSLSPYNYVANNPMIAFDPDGEDIWFVHGTFSTSSRSFTNKGIDLWSRALNDDVPHRFDWRFRSFLNENISRRSAARSLANQIEEAYRRNPEMLVQIVAHSHGGNVAIEAANILADRNISVDRLILLGTPSRDDFRLNGDEVSQLFNISNTEDLIQQLGGTDFPGLFTPAKLEKADRNRKEGEAQQLFEISFTMEGGIVEEHSFQNKKELIDFINSLLEGDN